MATDPTPEAVDAAIAAILARPEPEISQAAAMAAYEAGIALQHAGASGAERAASVLAFIAARIRLEAEDAAARFLP